MLNFLEMTNEQRALLALKFLCDFGGRKLITRDDFDLWIIDNELAEDPGTDDTRSAAHKGFVQQRSNARRSLNNWGKRLKEEDSFNVILADDEHYRIVTWESSAEEFSKNIGNLVKRYAENKAKEVSKIRRVVDDKIKLGASNAEIDRLYQAIGLIEGHAKQMTRRIEAEIKRYNNAILFVNKTAEAMLEHIAEADTEGREEEATAA